MPNSNKFYYWISVGGWIFCFSAAVFAAEKNSAVSPQKNPPSAVPGLTAAPGNAAEELMQDPFAATSFTPVATPVENTASETAAVPLDDLKLQGITIGSDKAGAIINGKFYTLGKNEDGIEVVEIRKKEVDIKGGGQTRTLSLSVLPKAAKPSDAETPAKDAGDAKQETAKMDTAKTNTEQQAVEKPDTKKDTEQAVVKTETAEAAPDPAAAPNS